MKHTVAVVCFVFLAHPDQIVSLSTSNKGTIETAEETIKTTSYIVNEAKLATKVSLITVCKGESSVGYKINCFADTSTEECERRYSETRSTSNVSGAYTY